MLTKNYWSSINYENYLYLLIYLCLYSCKAQNIIVESKSNDILIFNFKEDDIHLLLDKFNTPLYHNNKLIIFKQRWRGYGTAYIKKYYYFLYKKKDTMHIECNCGQERNYYFKNLEFKEGYYKLRLEELPEENILGSRIKTPIEVQSIFFKNTYVPPDEPTQRDIYFKNLEFIEVDLKDTINVKIKKVGKEAFPKKELR
jgi:hypothetical protein